MTNDRTAETAKAVVPAADSGSEGLRLLSLSLKNIGPFDSAEVTFADGDDGAPAVTIITGENGTGKSILVDAIRGMFGDGYASLERPIYRPGVPFSISLHLRERRHDWKLSSTSSSGGNRLALEGDADLRHLPIQVADQRAEPPPWVAHYWRSGLATDAYDIPSLTHPNHANYLVDSLQGQHQNADVTKLLCYFDYLRDSRAPQERRSGEAVYTLACRIISRSLLDGGELVYVRRSDMTPMVSQAGHEVPLANLSSGNAYLVQHLIGLLGKMYSLHVLLGTDAAELHKASGLLLIDEAENHLHPRWQKRFLPMVRELFPNLQIVATTHSPFVVASVPDARVLVCRYDRQNSTCTVNDETADYANKPIEDILRSDAFGETEPFGEEITRLLEAHGHAVAAGDRVTQKQIEATLLARNPSYFRYFEIEERFAAMQRGTV